MFKKIVKWSAISFGMLALIVGGSYWLIRPNIHQVVQGKIYRSAQLSGPQFYRMIKKHQIRSIINLRGASPEQKWYQQEMKVTQQLGVTHYDLKMYAYRLPEPTTLQELVKLLQVAPRPVLIHCEGGADRTGLASSIILLLKDDSLAKARKQISWRYLVLHSDSVGKLVMPYYKRWLSEHNYTSSKQHFLQWVSETQLNKKTQ